MPTYSYRCTECGHAFDIQQSFTDDALTAQAATRTAIRAVLGDKERRAVECDQLSDLRDCLCFRISPNISEPPVDELFRSFEHNKPEPAGERVHSKNSIAMGQWASHGELMGSYRTSDDSRFVIARRAVSFR